MSLRFRILLMTFGLVIGIVGCMLAVLSWIVNQQIAATASQIADQTNFALAHTLDGYQQRLQAETALLADRPGTRTLYETDAITISDHLNELASRFEADWLVMTDPDGRVIGATSEAPVRIGEPIRDRTWGRQREAKWRGVTTMGGGASVVATYPVKIGDYARAVLITGKDVDSSLLSQIGRATRSEIAVFGPSGILATTVPVPSSALKSNALQRVSIGGTTYVGESNPMPGNDRGANLRFLALVPEDAAGSQFDPLWLTLYGMLFVGLVCALIAGVWLALSVTNPLNGLISAARMVQENKWPEPTFAGRKDEIGLLQSVFDTMATSVRTSRNRLIAMVDIDPLTELWNYRSFREKLDQELETWELEGGSMGLIMFDIDQFEIYNREHGVSAGDELLRRIAFLLREVAGEHSLCGRSSGNVFTAAVRNRPLLETAERLRMRAHRELGITVSVGVCEAGDATRKSELLLLAAEITVGQAKTAGRNRTRVFDGFTIDASDSKLKAFLQQGSYAAVRALAEAVDAKDVYTRGHSDRVANYARELASACGFDEGFVELVYLTGTLHDVGKIGVPDMALNKPTQLTDEEFMLVKTHPALGEKIVSQIPQLKDTLPGIRHHHERWDGRGYPDGLAGVEIPLLARILAVADTFDAMTSDRPYRKGLSLEIALAEIERGAGTQFDPELAAAFVEMWSTSRQLLKQAS